MRTGRTLQPDHRIAHYRVVGPLGAGGMGEVYLAQDQTLERNVALKILPPELVRSEERVRRFVQEAKSASSLNHPNIVTIYEIGQDTVRSAGGEIEGDSSSLQYISMELVTGKTLAVKIHDEKTDLRTLLGYLAQAAEGLAKAHGAGIVHRDLKPSNIMVSDDGFAKVLDFGLAKLMEKRGTDPDQSTAPTQLPDQTSEGAVLGTVGYMSPEQVQGKPVDHRSDIFSFGCILYEAATRRRPFSADSNVETMHKILHDKPTPVEEINARVPAELRRVIRRCLAKNPDQRLQSMKDLAIELREIVEEYDTMSASASSGSGASRGVAPVAARRTPLVPILVGAAVVALGGLAIGWYGLQRARSGSASQPFQTMRITPLTSRGDVFECAISTDGRYLAYITEASGRYSLRVRQVATGSDVEVLPPSEAMLEYVNFSPDGNYVFYLKRRADAANYRTMFQIPSLGGSPQERGFDVDSRPSFSPDGKQVCFFRRFPQDQKGSVIVMDLETRKEREIAAARNPLTFPASPDWSPDGRHIAIAEQGPAPRSQAKVVIFDVENGRRRDLYTQDFAQLFDVAWLQDGKGIVIGGLNLHAGTMSQLSLISYPGGEYRRVTNDAYDYWPLSTSSGDEAIATVRQSRLANVWTADVQTGEARQATTFTSSEDAPFGAVVGDDGTVAYNAFQDLAIGLWSVSTPGANPRKLPVGPGLVSRPQFAGGTVVFSRLDPTGESHVWSISPDGSGLRQLTNRSGEELLSVSDRGAFATFKLADSTRGVWRVPLAGGEAQLIAPNAVIGRTSPSPDGQHVAVVQYSTRPNGLIESTIKVIPSAGGEPIATVVVPPQSAGMDWSVSNESILYMDRADSSSNVARIPFAGGAPQRVTSFSEGKVMYFALSPDGARLAIVRKIGKESSVWLAGADGSNPTRVKGFASNEVFDLQWAPNGRTVAINAGSESRDAVVLRGFR